MKSDGRWMNKKVAPKFGGNKIITYLCGIWRRLRRFG
jgi:hypothetical protein